LEGNETWDIMDPLPSKKPISCNWVYQVKYDSNGSIQCHKARLVICGNRQIEGFDYSERFGPMAKITIVRYFFAVAIAKGWDLCQMDANNVFCIELSKKMYI